jgi:hypothetical protein
MPTIHTIRLVASTSAVANSNTQTISNASNMYNNTDNTSYATITNTTASTSGQIWYLRGFNFNAIPTGTVITNFTIKVRGYESRLSTSTNNAPRLCNGTSSLSNTTASENFGTSSKIITIPHGNFSWSQISGYGANFGIYFVSARSNRSQTGYMYIQGAEIEVEYYYDIRYNVSITNNSASVTTSPNTTQSIFEGDDMNLYVFTDDKNNIQITDNNLDVSSQLIKHTSGNTTQSSYPTELLETNTIVSNFENMCDGTGSTTYGTMRCATNSYMKIGFSINPIPPTATNITVSCSVTCVVASNSGITDKKVQLYSGTTAKGNASTIPTSVSTLTLDTGTWTAAELEDLYMRFDAQYTGASTAYNVSVRGAELTVSYTMNEDYYVYTISNVPEVHTIVINDNVSESLKRKVNGNWVNITHAYKNTQGGWVERTDLTNLFQDGTIYVNG